MINDQKSQYRFEKEFTRVSIVENCNSQSQLSQVIASLFPHRTNVAKTERNVQFLRQRNLQQRWILYYHKCTILWHSPPRRRVS